MTAAKNPRLESINKRNRQESVAELSAQGLSDARIAERLGVTVRTIERDKRELRETPVEVTWQGLARQCGDYRAGFVRVFREHEGEIIEGEQCTAASFARHMGIAQQSFDRWLKGEDQDVPTTGTSRSSKKDQDAASPVRTVTSDVAQPVGKPSLKVVRDPETGQELQACGNPKSFEFKVTLASITIADYADDLISRATDRMRNLEDLIEAVQEFEKVWRDEYVPKHPDGEDTPDNFDESPLDVLPIEGTATDESVLEAIELVEEIVNQKYFVDDLTEKQREALDHLVLSINKLTTKE